MDNYLLIKQTFEEKLGFGKSFDVGVRELKTENFELSLYYVSGLVNDIQIEIILNTLITKNQEFSPNLLPHQQVKVLDDYDAAVDEVLRGTIVIISADEKFYTIDTKNYPTRGISEPDTEKVIRGARDGFTENFITNTALIRRRLVSNDLRLERFQIGNISKTNVCLCYVEGAADPELIEIIKYRLAHIDISELTMSDKKLEELITNQGFNPFPLLRYTERPDTLAVQLSKGDFGIIVDNSPSVIIGPVSYFDLLEHVEEFRQTPLIGTFLKIIRLMAVFISIFLVPLWLLINQNPNIFTNVLNHFVIENQVLLPFIIQILIAELGVELLRMAAIYTPNAISTAMGLIAGIVIGEIAIELGYFVKDIVFYVAISQIGNYSTPSYELSLANKFIKLILLILIALFNFYGLIFGVIVIFIYLATRKSINKPYLSPLVPFNFRKLLKVFIRFPAKRKSTQ